MTRLRERVAGLFLEPAPGERMAEAAASIVDPPVGWLPPVAPSPAAPSAPAQREGSSVPDRVAVVAAPGDATLAAAAVALGLMHRRRSPAAVVARWTGHEPSPQRTAPAAAAARRLSAGLVADGQAAHPSGRLVWVDLPAAEPAAVAAADRALRGAVPGLIVVAGSRSEVIDRALAACGVLIVAARDAIDPELLAAAVAELERLGPPAVALRLGVPAPAAALCRAGLALPAGLREPVAEALAAAGACA